VFVQEERVVLFVEDLSDAVGDRQKHLLVAAQHRRNAVDRAGRLPVQAAAVLWQRSLMAHSRQNSLHLLTQPATKINVIAYPTCVHGPEGLMLIVCANAAQREVIIFGQKFDVHRVLLVRQIRDQRPSAFDRLPAPAIVNLVICLADVMPANDHPVQPDVAIGH